MNLLKCTTSSNQTRGSNSTHTVSSLPSLCFPGTDLELVPPLSVAAVGAEDEVEVGSGEMDLLGPLVGAHLLVIAHLHPFCIRELQVVIPVTQITPPFSLFFCCTCHTNHATIQPFALHVLTFSTCELQVV